MSPPTQALHIAPRSAFRCVAPLLVLFAPAWGAQDPAPAPAQDPKPSEAATPPLPAAGQDPVAADQKAQPSAQNLDAGRVLEISLERAQELALERNLGLQIEAVNTEVAWYNHRATWGAFDWVVDARAGFTEAEFQPRDVFGGTDETSNSLSLDLTRPIATTGGTFRTHFTSNTTDTNSAFSVQPKSTVDVIALQYTQPLLRGAWREYATSTQRQSELDARRQDETLRQARQRLLLDVTLAYWNLVAARDALGVAESSLELARSQVDLNQRRLDAGAGTQVEVLQAQAEVARREELRLRADVDMRKAADDLKHLLQPGTNPVWWVLVLVPSTKVPEPGADETTVSWEVALAIAIERRAELRQQRFRIAANDVAHERTKSERKAALDLDLTASSSGFASKEWNAFTTTARYDFPTYEAALVFNYALGNRTATNNERAAWANLRAARLAYDDLESRITAEVRDGVRQVRYQAEAVRAADKSLELAQRQLAAEQARYENDLSTTFQVLQFQQDLAQAMMSARSARASYARALATLASAQGLMGELSNP
jgi:outer membrane protein TolC